MKRISEIQDQNDVPHTRTKEAPPNGHHHNDVVRFASRE